MHFVTSGFESSWRMKEFIDEKNIPFTLHEIINLADSSLLHSWPHIFLF